MTYVAGNVPEVYKYSLCSWRFCWGARARARNPRNGSYAYYVTIFFSSAAYSMKARLGGIAQPGTNKVNLSWAKNMLFKQRLVGRLTNPRLKFKNLHKFVTLLVYFVTTSATLKLHWWKI